MLKPFLEYLDECVVVCDGAMGTQLYSKGVFLNRCFDELNLSHPSLVQEVHQEYVWAGAEILETNTFGANRVKLESHGLADRVRDINSAGARIAREVAGASAYVGGSVGPLGIRVEPYGKMGVDEARAIFVEQIGALVEAGVDLLCLETFFDLNEIHAAILAAKEVCDLPIMAQLTLEEDGNSLGGSPPETFGRQLESWGADIIGANCGVGPQVMLESMERMATVVTRKLVAQPNAGKPRSFEGRNLYLSSPEYITSYARRFIRAGVRVVGGCCGTTPAHIKSIRSAVRALRPVPGKTVAVLQTDDQPPVDVIPTEQRSRLAQRILQKEPVFLVDIVPPRGGDPTHAIEGVSRFKAAGVDAVRISEAPRSSASMGAMALAVVIQTQSGVEPILHYTCGDRSLLSMQSELLGAYAMGLRNLCLSTGEPLRIGDYVDATAVHDVDSIGASHLVTSLNQGRDLGGKRIARPTGFFVGVTVDPAALKLEEEIRRLEYKVEAGAHFAITTPIFRPEVLEAFLRRIEHLKLPLIASIRPLFSYDETEFLNNEVTGFSIPDALLARMRGAGSPEREKQAGIAIAHEIVQAVRSMAQGIEVRIPGDSYGLAMEISRQ
jgi:methionine synthase / methylenetetrahydrofolate reductase (NADH)